MQVNDFFNSINNSINIRVISSYIVIGIAILIIGAIIIIRMLRAPAGKKQLMEYNSYKELAKEQKETTREMREELAVLKEKVDSIEKILKEVE